MRVYMVFKDQIVPGGGGAGTEAICSSDNNGMYILKSCEKCSECLLPKIQE